MQSIDAMQCSQYNRYKQCSQDATPSPNPRAEETTISKKPQCVTRVREGGREGGRQGGREGGRETRTASGAYDTRFCAGKPFSRAAKTATPGARKGPRSSQPDLEVASSSFVAHPTHLTSRSHSSNTPHFQITPSLLKEVKDKGKEIEKSTNRCQAYEVQTVAKRRGRVDHHLPAPGAPGQLRT